MTKPAYLTALAQSLPSTVPFVGPEAQERASGVLFTARLGANELGFGPSPKAITAMQMAAAEAWMYPDPESHDLRHAIAAHHGVDAAHIMVGEGIDTLLGVLVRLTVAQGDPVVTSAGAYPTFNYHVNGVGGALHTVPYNGDFEDLDALSSAAHRVGAKLIYLANPDNPMGSYHAGLKIVAMRDTLPADTLLVLDEAYIDLAPDDALPQITADDPRVIRMRTFSKGYGLAGARVGYAIGHPDLITAFHKIRNHFGMSRISQAGAQAALGDQDYLMQVKEHVSQSRHRLGQIAADNGLTALPSATNFVTIDCGRDSAFAKTVLKGLLAQRIFVRMPFVAPQDCCIRIGCGPAPLMDLVAKALPDALAQAKITHEA